jgi:O-antigen/teichoic acid export membrane protein
MIEVRRKRLRWLLPAVILFVVAAFAFTRQLLALFRPEFVDDGIVALRLIAVATAFTMLFSLAPAHLKLRQRNRITFATVVCAAIAQIFLLVLLIPRFEATGAAAAYAISMASMYGFFALMARRDLARLRGPGEGR